jgi:hypothetical protein
MERFPIMVCAHALLTLCDVQGAGVGKNTGKERSYESGKWKVRNELTSDVRVIGKYYSYIAKTLCTGWWPRQTSDGNDGVITNTDDMVNGDEIEIFSIEKDYLAQWMPSASTASQEVLSKRLTFRRPSNCILQSTQ